MTKVIIAPDSYKGCFSAIDVAHYIQKGLLMDNLDLDISCIPMADGGEGTVDAVMENFHGQKIYHKVRGPLSVEREAYYGWVEKQKLAVIEMAQASGLEGSVPSGRNPLIADSFGTGQMIVHALEQGAKDILVGLGGSATNDGGAGMMRALGARFLNARGEDLSFGGQALLDLDSIDTSQLHPLLAGVRFHVACDVDNPLCGPQGASQIFGPQKGASLRDIQILDSALHHYGQVLSMRDNKDILSLQGAGAAGGMGAAFYGFFPNCSFRSGIDVICDLIDFEAKIKGASWLITGEGRMDKQTCFGKTPMGIAKRAGHQNIPVIAINGSLGDGYESILEYGFTAVFDTVVGVMDLNEALSQSAHNLTQISRNIARLIFN